MSKTTEAPGSDLEVRRPDVTDPAAVLRLATTANQVHADLEDMTLDEKGAERLADLHDELCDRLSGLLAPDLAAELRIMVPPLTADRRTPAATKLAHGQLTGWIDGLLAGMQATSVAARLTHQAATPPAPAAPTRTTPTPADLAQGYI